MIITVRERILCTILSFQIVQSRFAASFIYSENPELKSSEMRDTSAHAPKFSLLHLRTRAVPWPQLSPGQPRSIIRLPWVPSWWNRIPIGLYCLRGMCDIGIRRSCSYSRWLVMAQSKHKRLHPATNLRCHQSHKWGLCGYQNISVPLSLRSARHMQRACLNSENVVLERPWSRWSCQVILSFFLSIGTWHQQPEVSIEAANHFCPCSSIDWSAYCRCYR